MVVQFKARKLNIHARKFLGEHLPPLLGVQRVFVVSIIGGWTWNNFDTHMVPRNVAVGMALSKVTRSVSNECMKDYLISKTNSPWLMRTFVGQIWDDVASQFEGQGGWPKD